MNFTSARPPADYHSAAPLRIAPVVKYFLDETAATVSQMFCLKTRYIYTRRNRLRLRYVVSTTAAFALIAGLYVGGMITPSAEAPVVTPGILASVSSVEGDNNHESDKLLSFVMNRGKVGLGLLGADALAGHRDRNGQIRRDPQVKESAQLAERAAESPAAEEKHLEVRSGDTLAEVLVRGGLDSAEAQDVVNSVSRHFDFRALRSGQAVDLTVEPSDSESGYRLASLSFSPDPLRTIEVSRDAEDNIVASVDQKVAKPTREARKVVIDGSVYGSADRAELPDKITANTIKLFSYAVDFQRDIRQGDKLDVLYDSYKTDDGYVARTGDIVFARLKVQDKEYALYRYENSDGQVDYYTSDGRSIRKSAGLMRTPVAFGRLSSGFGLRRHPVLGYTKMHKGVDFAAPIGTPVYASGDGLIERAGPFSSFGNYVRVRHSAKLSTAYAHLSRFGKGIRPGIRVKQGQIIGYVGTTGRSTGPHLHYEVMVNNTQVNPSSVKLAVDTTLKGNDLRRFKMKVRSLGQEYAQKVSGNPKLAYAKQAETEE